MAMLVINSHLFDIEWKGFASTLPDNNRFNLLTALKEGVRDYVTVTKKTSPLFIDISGQTCKLEFITDTSQSGCISLELQSFKLLNGDATRNIKLDFSIKI